MPRNVPCPLCGGHLHREPARVVCLNCAADTYNVDSTSRARFIQDRMDSDLRARSAEHESLPGDDWQPKRVKVLRGKSGWRQRARQHKLDVAAQQV